MKPFEAFFLAGVMPDMAAVLGVREEGGVDGVFDWWWWSWTRKEEEARHESCKIN